MKKSTKILAMVVAVTFVITAMVVVIYSAVAGNVNINASVSWTAQVGVDLEFWATSIGGSNGYQTINSVSITPSTTNDKAGVVGDFSCSFKDSVDNGVNDPNPITFSYFIRNKS